MVHTESKREGDSPEKRELTGEWLSFSNVATKICLTQSKFARHHLELDEAARDGASYLGDGIRVHIPTQGDYHSYQIHRDDVPIFVERFVVERLDKMLITDGTAEKIRANLVNLDELIESGRISKESGP